MMSSSPLTPPMSLKNRATKNSVKLSPLSWAQYLAESPQTSSKSSETEIQRMRRMQKLFHSWRDDQIVRARLRRGPRFVSSPLAISPKSSAAIQNTLDTTTATEPTLTVCPRQVPTLSLCDLQVLQDTPWGPSMEFRQLARRGRSRSTGTLSMPRDISAGTMSMKTKKTMKIVKISPRVSQKRLRFGDDVGKREFIKFAKKYH